jgi:hypothetical protein
MDSLSGLAALLKGTDYITARQHHCFEMGMFCFKGGGWKAEGGKMQIDF